MITTRFIQKQSLCHDLLHLHSSSWSSLIKSADCQHQFLIISAEIVFNPLGQCFAVTIPIAKYDAHVSKINLFETHTTYHKTWHREWTDQRSGNCRILQLELWWYVASFHHCNNYQCPRWNDWNHIIRERDDSKLLIVCPLIIRNQKMNHVKWGWHLQNGMMNNVNDIPFLSLLFAITLPKSHTVDTQNC